MAALVVFNFIPRRERQVAEFDRLKSAERQAKRALDRSNPRATGHGALRRNLERAKAARVAAAVGLQDGGVPFLYSLPAMVALQCALLRDCPGEIPEWWSPDKCVECGSAVATLCHSLSSDMNR